MRKSKVKQDYSLFIDLTPPGVYPNWLKRCECGELVSLKIPSVCKCGKQFNVWTEINGNVLDLEKMDLGHLNNCIRMLAEKVDGCDPELRAGYEVALDLFYAEIGSRDKEIEQQQGILAALTRSLENER